METNWSEEINTYLVKFIEEHIENYEQIILNNNIV